MLGVDRRAGTSARRGMTVLGKIPAVPKPINLPSQRLENRGLDPNVEIVPRGTVTWGTATAAKSPPTSGGGVWGAPASSAPAPAPAANAWGVAPTPRTEPGATGPPPAGGGGGAWPGMGAPNSAGELTRPGSGGSGSRPSSAGGSSDRAGSASWGSSTRPATASSVHSQVVSEQVAQPQRPHSAEARQGTAAPSRFGDSLGPAPPGGSAWSGGGRKLGEDSHQPTRFQLSKGDFPELGTEKNPDLRPQQGPGAAGGGEGAVEGGGGSRERPRSAEERRPGSQPGYRDDMERRSLAEEAGHADSWRRAGGPGAYGGSMGGSDMWRHDGPLEQPGMGPPLDSWKREPSAGFPGSGAPPDDSWRRDVGAAAGSGPQADSWRRGGSSLGAPGGPGGPAEGWRREPGPTSGDVEGPPADSWRRDGSGPPPDSWRREGPPAGGGFGPGGPSQRGFPMHLQEGPPFGGRFGPGPGGFMAPMGSAPGMFGRHGEGFGGPGMYGRGGGRFPGMFPGGLPNYEGFYGPPPGPGFGAVEERDMVMRGVGGGIGPAYGPARGPMGYGPPGGPVMGVPLGQGHADRFGRFGHGSREVSGPGRGAPGAKARQNERWEAARPEGEGGYAPRKEDNGRSASSGDARRAGESSQDGRRSGRAGGRTDPQGHWDWASASEEEAGMDFTKPVFDDEIVGEEGASDAGGLTVGNKTLAGSSEAGKASAGPGGRPMVGTSMPLGRDQGDGLQGLAGSSAREGGAGSSAESSSLTREGGMTAESALADAAARGQLASPQEPTKGSEPVRILRRTGDRSPEAGSSPHESRAFQSAALGSPSANPAETAPQSSGFSVATEVKPVEEAHVEKGPTQTSVAVEPSEPETKEVESSKQDQKVGRADKAPPPPPAAGPLLPAGRLETFEAPESGRAGNKEGSRSTVARAPRRGPATSAGTKAAGYGGAGRGGAEKAPGSSSGGGGGFGGSGAGRAFTRVPYQPAMLTTARAPGRPETDPQPDMPLTPGGRFGTKEAGPPAPLPNMAGGLLGARPAAPTAPGVAEGVEVKPGQGVSKETAHGAGGSGSGEAGGASLAGVGVAEMGTELQGHAGGAPAVRPEGGPAAGSAAWDYEAQRTKLRESAQRAQALKKAEEERMREQKARAQAKLEELERRKGPAAKAEETTPGTQQVGDANQQQQQQQQQAQAGGAHQSVGLALPPGTSAASDGKSDAAPASKGGGLPSGGGVAAAGVPAPGNAVAGGSQQSGGGRGGREPGREQQQSRRNERGQGEKRGAAVGRGREEPRGRPGPHGSSLPSLPNGPVSSEPPLLPAPNLNPHPFVHPQARHRGPGGASHGSEAQFGGQGQGQSHMRGLALTPGMSQSQGAQPPPPPPPAPQPQSQPQQQHLHQHQHRQDGQPAKQVWEEKQARSTGPHSQSRQEQPPQPQPQPHTLPSPRSHPTGAPAIASQQHGHHHGRKEQQHNPQAIESQQQQPTKQGCLPGQAAAGHSQGQARHKQQEQHPRGSHVSQQVAAAQQGDVREQRSGSGERANERLSLGSQNAAQAVSGKPAEGRKEQVSAREGTEEGEGGGEGAGQRPKKSQTGRSRGGKQRPKGHHATGGGEGAAGSGSDPPGPHSAAGEVALGSGKSGPGKEHAWTGSGAGTVGGGLPTDPVGQKGRGEQEGEEGKRREVGGKESSRGGGQPPVMTPAPIFGQFESSMPDLAPVFGTAKAQSERAADLLLPNGENTSAGRNAQHLDAAGSGAAAKKSAPNVKGQMGPVRPGKERGPQDLRVGGRGPQGGTESEPQWLPVRHVPSGAGGPRGEAQGRPEAKGLSAGSDTGLAPGRSQRGEGERSEGKGGVGDHGVKGREELRGGHLQQPHRTRRAEMERYSPKPGSQQQQAGGADSAAQGPSAAQPAPQLAHVAAPAQQPHGRQPVTGGTGAPSQQLPAPEAGTAGGGQGREGTQSERSAGVKGGGGRNQSGGRRGHPTTHGAVAAGGKEPDGGAGQAAHGGPGPAGPGGRPSYAASSDRGAQANQNVPGQQRPLPPAARGGPLPQRGVPNHQPPARQAPPNAHGPSHQQSGPQGLQQEGPPGPSGRQQTVQGMVRPPPERQGPAAAGLVPPGGAQSHPQQQQQHQQAVGHPTVPHLTSQSTPSANAHKLDPNHQVPANSWGDGSQGEPGPRTAEAVPGDRRFPRGGGRGTGSLGSGPHRGGPAGGQRSGEGEGRKERPRMVINATKGALPGHVQT